MLKKLQFLFAFLIIASVCFSQVKINEGFETSDSINLPTGWTKWNNAGFPTNDTANWTVRDSGVYAFGINTHTTVAHTGMKSCGVTWRIGVDTNGAYLVADAWLVTKRIENITTDDVLRIWATGGTDGPPVYYDSLTIWISLIDNTPAGFLGTAIKLADIYWPGGIYGQFTEYTYSLAPYAGADSIWIGFRYNFDITDAYMVQIDDVFVGVPGSVQQIGTNIPDKFALNQNYPNPFNPTTTIRFDLARNTSVNLIVYNSLGQEVTKVFDGYKQAGTYEAVFDASGLSSGTYYYRLTTDYFVETKKMVVVK